ncbi:MAG TPA: GNAT family N-acetyltransferase, partial [Nocardioides sp.]
MDDHTLTIAPPRPAHVLLADGRIASIRPMRDDDGPALMALHDDVDSESLRLRFFVGNRLAAHRYVDHLTGHTGDTVATLVSLVDGRLVGLASAERTDPESAEVAFLIADSERGRGLGSLLLEHLAARCRDVGIRRFVAEVLPENAAMIRVFRDAGFEVTRSTRDGVVHVAMSTEASAAAIEAADLRECVSEARSLAPLLRPRSVAVAGVRRDAGGLGHAVLASIRAGGFTGSLHVVHPAVDEIDGVRAWPRFVDVPEQVDLAVVAVPAERVLDAVGDAADAGVPAVVVISSGLGELGERGAELQRDLLELTRERNVRLVGPNC